MLVASMSQKHGIRARKISNLYITTKLSNGQAMSVGTQVKATLYGA